MLQHATSLPKVLQSHLTRAAVRDFREASAIAGRCGICVSTTGLIHNGKLSRKPLSPKRLTIRTLLRPHTGALILGLLAVIGESAANLLEPWPLKIVLDNVLHSKASNGWLN